MSFIACVAGSFGHLVMKALKHYRSTRLLSLGSIVLWPVALVQQA
jgi:hypothetical protein